jgi:hypothetical protein
VQWLKHAFAVGPAGPAEPTPLEQPIVDWLCLKIAQRRLTTPGLVFLEMCRPLNYFGAQAMHVLQPGVWAIAGPQSYADYVQLARFLERRGAIDYLMRRVEHFEAELARREQAGEPIGPFVEQHMAQVRSVARQVKAFEQVAAEETKKD